MLNDKLVFLYSTFCSLLALGIFIYGYVPLSSLPKSIASHKDLPIEIDGFSVNQEKVYFSHVEKLVVILADSLNMDVLTDNAQVYLPYTMQLINDRHGCIVPCRIPQLSTTLQKIKTLATGTTSLFVESILNTFRTDELKVDSIFYQAKNDKHNISLQGGKFWTQLFPDTFTVGSKVVDDEEQLNKNSVDHSTQMNNSTGSNEISWNWLLLHYSRLNLLEAIFNSKYRNSVNKLRKIDQAIKSAYAKLSAQTNDYLILVVGDTSTGEGLNGFSKSYGNPQAIAPYILIGKFCLKSHSLNLMDDIDLAPTLAVLTGVPIPASSYGKLSSNFFDYLTDDQMLYALYYNTAKLANLSMQVETKYDKDSTHLLFKKAVVQHGNYLKATELKERLQLRDTIKLLYSRTAESFSHRIKNVLIVSDVSIQYLAFVLVLEAMIMLANKLDKDGENRMVNFIVISISNLMILTWVLATGMSKRGTSFINMPTSKGLVIGIITLIMFCNSYILASQKSFLTLMILACSARSTQQTERSKEIVDTVSSSIDEPILSNTKLKTNSLLVLLVTGTIIHAFSYLEQSYIKCEKWIWFYLWSSLCCFILYKCFGKIYRSNRNAVLNAPALNDLDYNAIPVVLSILIMHRIILVYTGIQDWLLHDSDHLCASICLLFGLLLLGITCSIYYEPFSSVLDVVIIRLLLVFLCISIYLSNVARGNVGLPYYGKSDGVLEMTLFWCSWTLIIGYGLGFCTIGTCYKGISSTRQLMATAVTCWGCFSALFTQSHKVLLIPIEMLFGQAMSDVFRKQNQCLIISHIWLGHLFFYHQGYGYNLDGIDLAAGLLHSSGLCSFIYGVCLVLNVFSALILSYFICIHGMLDNNVKKSSSEEISEANATFGYCQFILLSVYLLSMLVHCCNDWFWGILTPKFFYEVAYTFIIFGIMIAMLIVGLLHDLCLKSRVPYL